jgi:translation initiation factor IF-1
LCDGLSRVRLRQGDEVTVLVVPIHHHHEDELDMNAR